ATCHAEPPDLLISDVGLKSAGSGLETLLRVHEHYPQLPLLIISGTPPEGWRNSDFDCFRKLVMNGGQLGFLQKPFTAQSLRAEVDTLISGKSDPPRIRALFDEAAKYRRSGA